MLKFNLRKRKILLVNCVILNSKILAKIKDRIAQVVVFQFVNYAALLNGAFARQIKRSIKYVIGVTIINQI